MRALIHKLREHDVVHVAALFRVLFLDAVCHTRQRRREHAAPGVVLHPVRVLVLPEEPLELLRPVGLDA